MPERTNALPWRREFIRFSLVALTIVGVGFYLMQRYRIGIDTQAVRCFPDFHVYLIDLWDKKTIRGGLYAFYAKGLSPIYPDGTQMLKRLTGIPGDKIQVVNEQVLINGNTVSTGMPLAKRLGATPSQFHRTLTLSEKNYWFSGDAPTSFDSRYWNTVTHHQLVGRAWALW